MLRVMGVECFSVHLSLTYAGGRVAVNYTR